MPVPPPPPVWRDSNQAQKKTATNSSQWPQELSSMKTSIASRRAAQARPKPRIPGPCGHPNSVVITDGARTAPDTAQRRAGNDQSCANCGKRLYPKRGSRRMRFCSVACRQSALRARKWASRYEGREPLRSTQNKAIASMACNGHFRHRASGICGPNRVVSRELFAGVTWCVVVSSDGIRAEVARLGNGAAP